uniref:hypothetical protein n=1 Tax=Ornithobacterium rhinotracheale TaxID=28251 RepID=UPI0039A47779
MRNKSSTTLIIICIILAIVAVVLFLMNECSLLQFSLQLAVPILIIISLKLSQKGI